MGFGDLKGGVTIPPPPPPHLHPKEMGLDPNQGLNQFHQLDLGEKHSSIPEKRTHNCRSSGNRRRLMKCRLVLWREGVEGKGREGGRAGAKTQMDDRNC